MTQPTDPDAFSDSYPTEVLPPVTGPLGPTAQTWQRLDRRMLLVHPVTELIRYIPVLIATLVAGARADSPMWSLAVVAVIVAFALTRWFTTTYRITPENVELRTGLIQRKRLSVPRNRVRSVDVQADLLHRALGLAVLSIGTGQHSDKKDQFKLDALDAQLVPELRLALLAHTREDSKSADSQSITTSGESAPDASDSRPGVEIAHWQPDWVRYAPLSLTGFAIVAPVVGLAFQYGFAQIFLKSGTVQDVGHRGAGVIAAVIALLFVVLVVVVSVAACARYLMTWFGLNVHDDGKTLTIRHGLFTTRQTTLDLARLRGATVNEPLLLRVAGAAELEAIMVGTSPRQKILPQAPRTAIDRTLAHLLGTAEATANSAGATANSAGAGAEWQPSVPAPVTVPLLPHGPAALRRRCTRTLGPLAAAATMLIAISLAGGHIPTWLWVVLAIMVPFAATLAWDRYRGLGHAVLPATAGNPAWLVTRSGSLDRDRDCVEAPGIIGWTVRQTFFQRRAGVATVVAASAAGKKRYHVIDIPLARAYELIDQVTPGRTGYRR
ncbi:PH domain-containing protein [Nocardia seriolae]|uniref:Membrane protein n=1 Tax=Nocardia seriolae TaxID=37332 RepID=A0ABC9YWA1_9NOCA|nr:PH domain-containing protein [Nocardia seriolae]BEK98721.1 PH domain-containing protein [Nocardia seriolae]GAM47398.1 membrane protein [Nocardia seriolae]GAP29306.1 membrane protein [Nocardia seriolae]